MADKDDTKDAGVRLFAAVSAMAAVIARSLVLAPLDAEEDAASHAARLLEEMQEPLDALVADGKANADALAAVAASLAAHGYAPGGDFSISEMADATFASFAKLNAEQVGEIAGLKRQLAAQKGQTTKARNDRDEVSAELAARGPEAKARAVDQDGLLSGSSAYDHAVTGGDVEVVATYQDRELLTVPPLRVSPAGWRLVNDHLALTPETQFKVHGPATGGDPIRITGFALFVDGDLIAAQSRDPQVDIGPGQTFNLAGDIAF